MNELVRRTHGARQMRTLTSALQRDGGMLLKKTLQGWTGHLFVEDMISVSYTHLDVYKRQV